jgi:hypothetical protein
MADSIHRYIKETKVDFWRCFVTNNSLD